MAASKYVKQDFRIPAETLKKLHWLADECETSLQQVVRDVLHAAVKDCQPPVSREKYEFSATEEQLQSYADLAAAKGVTLDELLRSVLDRLVLTHLPK